MLGMARTTGAPPLQWSRLAQSMPAAMDSTKGMVGCAAKVGASAIRIGPNTWGFTASTTASAPSTAAALSSKSAMGPSAERASRQVGLGSETRRAVGSALLARRPPSRAWAMLPPPMKATVLGSARVAPGAVLSVMVCFPVWRPGGRRGPCRGEGGWRRRLPPPRDRRSCPWTARWP